MRRSIALLAAATLMLAAPIVSAQNDQDPPDRRERSRGQDNQRGRQFQQREQLSDEDKSAAWELQAKGVATGLNLSEENTIKLVEVYKDARKSHGEASSKILEEMREQMQERMREGGGEGRGGGGEGRGGGREGRGGGGDREGGGGRFTGGGGFGGGNEFREKIDGINKSEREKLNTVLAEFLEGKELTRAEKSLGTFDTRWDRAAHTINGFKLDEETTYVAAWAIEEYIVASGNMRRTQSEDREKAMEKMRKGRDKLNKQLEEILSKEQMQRLSRSLGMGGGERGRRGGGGGGGGI